MDKESFADIRIREFALRLGSGDPTPGGGAAAALQAALGASLLMMVANLTIGKPKYAEFEELNRDILAETEEIRSRLIEGMDRDAEAFGRLMDALAMPKNFSDIQIDRVSAEIERLRAAGFEIDDIDEEGMTPEIMDQIEYALRGERVIAVVDASKEAAEAPLSLMEDALRVLRMAGVMTERSNTALRSDLEAAARSLHSGIHISCSNVEANLPAIERADAALAEELRSRAAAMLTETDRLAEDILTGTKK